MNHGANPYTRKKHHLSTRSFGAAAPVYAPFTLDAGFGFPNQNADGHPDGCRTYTTLELCEDEDRAQYDRDHLAASIAIVDGHPPYAAGDVTDALEAVCVYGVAKPGENDTQAEGRKRGRWFTLEQEPALDWFDSAVAVMQATKRSLSVASPWFPQFETAAEGWLPATFPLGWPAGVPGHNHKVYGLVTVFGVPYLLGKSWQGPNFGDHGVCYWSRDAFNRLLSIPGSGAFTVAPWDGSITTIQYGIIYRLRLLLRLYARRFTESVGTLDPDSYFDAWDSPKHNWHNVRVLCDRAGLTLLEKNVICACLYQESQFHNYEPNGSPVICQNKDKTGAVWSTDWGLCQINDWFHIAPHGEPFPSVAYVLANPAAAVTWMITMYKEGQLKQWSSYSSRAYQKWLQPGSPMWALAE